MAPLRLCVVDLFDKNAAHAKTVLRRQEAVRLREATSIGLHPTSIVGGAQGDFERSVIDRSLGEVAKRPTK